MAREKETPSRFQSMFAKHEGNPVFQSLLGKNLGVPSVGIAEISVKDPFTRPDIYRKAVATIITYWKNTPYAQEIPLDTELLERKATEANGNITQKEAKATVGFAITALAHLSENGNKKT